MTDGQAPDYFETTDGLPYYRAAMAQASRLISPSIDGVSPVQRLLDAPASWAMLDTPCRTAPTTGTRLQSPRRRGVAPAYPSCERETGMRDGTLIVFPGGFVLEPIDPQCPCINVSRSMVQAATFYRDAFDVSLSPGQRFVVRTREVERVDSIFQAYFWNSMA